MKHGGSSEINKRWGSLRLLLLAIVTVMLLSACSAQSGGNEAKGKTNNDQNSESPAPAAPAENKEAEQGTAAEETVEEAAEETPATRIYEHMNGKSEIPAQAGRVVTDWYYGQLVALGVKPIGTDDYVWNNHPFIEQAGTESIGQSLEKVIALEPDLIISWGANRYDDFSKIAPTVPLELSGGPKEAVQIFGDILGRTEEAAQWIARFDQNAAQYREQIAQVVDAGETFTIFNVWKNTLRVYGFVNMGGYALYEALQMKPQAKVDELFRGSEEWYREISFEVIPEFAGDHIIMTSYDPDGTSTVLQELADSAVWNSLDAVKNKQVYTIDYNSLYFDDPIAVENQVKVLAEAIIAAQ